MNWKKEAVNDLKDYPLRLESIANIEGRIKALEEDARSLGGISSETPVKGGASRQEDRLINNIAERQNLELNLKVTRQLVSITKGALAKLEKDEYDVLNSFYIAHTPNHIEALCDRLHLEKTRVYELKDRALRKFTLLVYGISEL